MTTLESCGSSFSAKNPKNMTSHTGRSVTAFAEVWIQSTPIFCKEPEAGSGDWKKRKETETTAGNGRSEPSRRGPPCVE